MMHRPQVPTFNNGMSHCSAPFFTMFQRERRCNKPASAGGFRQHLENRCCDEARRIAAMATYSERHFSDRSGYTTGLRCSGRRR